MNHLFHETHLIDSFPSRKLEESDIFNNQSINIQTYNQSSNIVNNDFVFIVNDDRMHSSIDLTKSLIFDDLPFEGLEVC